MSNSPNPFAAKLTFKQRCFIFAAHHYKQVGYPVLAQVFDINMETVGKICRSGRKSRGYRSVYMEADRMGLERMWEEYADPSAWALIESAQLNRGADNYGVQVATGPGAYWLPGNAGSKHRIEIQHTDYVRKVEPTTELYDWEGYLVHYKELGWAFEGQDKPWASIQEVLRYFAAYPSALEHVG